MINQYKWVWGNAGLVCLDGNTRVGVVVIPLKGTWCQWILLAANTSPADANTGRVNGRNKAKAALITRYEMIKRGVQS